jgi:flagellar basal body-associated protein FliL
MAKLATNKTNIMDIGDAAARSHVLINCKSDQDGITEDTLNAASRSTNLFRLYDAPSDKTGYFIHRGDILWTLKSSSRRNRSKWNDQQPIVRSVVNGLMLPTVTGLPTQVEVANYALYKKQFMRNIRIVGLSNKDVSFGTAANGAKTGRAGDDPVAVISGLLTTCNTGNKAIEAGQIILAQLPDPNEVQQGSYDLHEYASRDRKVMRTVPMAKMGLNINLITLGAITRSIFINPNFVGLFMNKTPAEIKQLFEDYNQYKINPADVPAGSRLNDASVLAAWENLAPSEVAINDDAVNDEILNLFMRNSKKFNNVITEAETYMRDSLNEQLQTMVGVATTSAVPGNRFDIMVQPPMCI